jgi:hypothetical protein
MAARFASQSKRRTDGQGGIAPEHCFVAPPAAGEFIRPNRRRSTKILLFLFAALTLSPSVLRSIVRSTECDRIAEFDGAACAAKKR